MRKTLITFLITMICFCSGSARESFEISLLCGGQQSDVGGLYCYGIDAKVRSSEHNIMVGFGVVGSTGFFSSRMISDGSLVEVISWREQRIVFDAYLAYRFSFGEASFYPLIGFSGCRIQATHPQYREGTYGISPGFLGGMCADLRIGKLFSIGMKFKQRFLQKERTIESPDSSMERIDFIGGQELAISFGIIL